jgi:hypothetical protein
MAIELYIYLANVLGKLDYFCRLAGFIGIVCAAFGFVIVKAISEPRENTSSAEANWFLVFKVSLGLIVFSCFTPSTNTVYMMAGAAYGKEAIQSETAVKVKKIIDSQLDKILEELDKK